MRVVGRRDKAGNFIALFALDEQKRLIVSYPYVSSGSWAHWIAVARYSLALSVPFYMIYIGLFLIDALTGDGLSPPGGDRGCVLDMRSGLLSPWIQNWPPFHAVRKDGRCDIRNAGLSKPYIPTEPPQSPSPAPWPALLQSPGPSAASCPDPAPAPTAPPGAGA